MKATTRFLPVLALLATTATQPVSAQVAGAAPSIHFNVLPPMMGDLQVGGQNYFEFRYTENSGASDYALRVSYSEDFSNGGDPPANWQYLSEPLFDGNRDRVTFRRLSDVGALREFLRIEAVPNDAFSL